MPFTPVTRTAQGRVSAPPLAAGAAAAATAAATAPSQLPSPSTRAHMRRQAPLRGSPNGRPRSKHARASAAAAAVTAQSLCGRWAAAASTARRPAQSIPPSSLSSAAVGGAPESATPAASRKEASTSSSSASESGTRSVARRLSAAPREWPQSIVTGGAVPTASALMKAGCTRRAGWGRSAVAAGRAGCHRQPAVEERVQERHPAGATGATNAPARERILSTG